MAALTAAGIGGADAQVFHRGPVVMHRDVLQREVMRRPVVMRARVFETLRMHRLVALGEPYFFHGRTVVRGRDRFGRLVLVELDPWTGRFLGVVRI
ncbi:MAG: hypothetical protein JO256_01135 [Alphaproteobacteria bacterium]|nr:hypothetical protein [Alphaproteobacteria bacterium]